MDNTFINIREWVTVWTRILFPESGDIRVLIAAITLSIEGIIHPVLIGDRFSMIETLSSPSEREKYKLDTKELSRQISILETIETIPLDPSYQENLITRYMDKKWESRESAKKKFPMDLAQATGLIKNEQVHWVVSWSIATTADVIRVGYYGLGLRKWRRISWEFIMVPDELSRSQEVYIIGDSAVNPDPSADDLVSLAGSLVETHEAFRPEIPPRIAFLSYSTHESGTGASSEKVQKALALFRERYPEISCDWPLQFDAAIDRDTYLSKTKGSWRLDDLPNILVFPNLDAGNIAYKMMERWWGYHAVWPILTGFSSPGWSDLSRGTTIDTIVDMAYVTALLTQSVPDTPTISEI